MTAPKTAPIAPYCFSTKCVDHSRGIGKGTVKEGLSNSATYCPDCKSVLVWKKLGAFRNPGLRASHKNGQ
jgi:hypothetical protein